MSTTPQQNNNEELDGAPNMAQSTSNAMTNTVEALAAVVLDDIRSQLFEVVAYLRNAAVGGNDDSVLTPTIEQWREAIHMDSDDDDSSDDDDEGALPSWWIYRSKPTSLKNEVHHDDVCSICLDPDWNNKAVQLNCGHIFHHECTKTWYEQKGICSNCRAPTTCCNHIIVLPATSKKRKRSQQPK